MQLEKSSAQERPLFVGFAMMDRVVAINPTKEDLAEVLNYDLKNDAKDLVYEAKNDKSEEVLTISVWMEAQTAEKQKFNHRFRFVDKVVTSETSGKKQFVNQSGMSTWVDSIENLPSWFTDFRDKNGNLVTQDKDGNPLTGKKKCREAIQGEADFYNFLQAWLGKANFFSEKTNILFDKDKMFRNLDNYVDKTYRAQITAGSDSLCSPFAALAYVGVVEKDGETKMYQNLYSDFISSYKFKKFALAMSTKDWSVDKAASKWHEQATGKYGCKGAYEFCMLKPFDPSIHQVASDNTFKEEGNGPATPPSDISW